MVFFIAFVGCIVCCLGFIWYQSRIVPANMQALLEGKYHCIGRDRWRIRLYLTFLDIAEVLLTLQREESNDQQKAYGRVYLLEFAQQCKVLGLGYKRQIERMEEISLRYFMRSSTCFLHFSARMLDRLFTVLNRHEPHELNTGILSAFIDAFDLDGALGLLQKYRTHIMSDSALREKFIDRCVRDANLQLLRILMEPTQPIVQRMYDVHKAVRSPYQWMNILAFLGLWKELFLLFREYELEGEEEKANQCLRLLAAKEVLQVTHERSDQPASHVQQ